MQIQIGDVRFDARNLAAHETERIRARRWTPRARRGQPPALEDLGREAETLRLMGQIPIRTARDRRRLDGLRQAAGLTRAAAAGEREQPAKALPLFAPGPSGAVHLGWWAVTELTATERQLRTDEGIPTVIEFTLTLLEHADQPAEDA